MVEMVDHPRIALREGAEDLQPDFDDIRVHHTVKILAVL
jgi:hypothetical protein